MASGNPEPSTSEKKLNNQVNFELSGNLPTNTVKKAIPGKSDKELNNNVNNQVNFELSVKPKTATKVIITDGNSGSLEFLPGFELCTIKNGNMKRLCEEAYVIINRSKDKELIRIVILGGNSSLDPSTIIDIPEDTLRRDKQSIVNQYVSKVIDPVKVLSKVSKEAGSKIAVCSLIPRLANFRFKSETLVIILSEAFMKANDCLKALNTEFELPCVHVNRDLEVKPNKTPVYVTGQRKVKTHLYNPDGISLSLQGQRYVQGVLSRVLEKWI